MKKTPRFLTSERGVASLLKQAPPLHFTGKSKDDWKHWRKHFRRRLVELLGRKPPPVPLEVETLERTPMEGYVREKIIFNPDPFSSIPAYVLVPDGASSSHPRPAVLCAHGHAVRRAHGHVVGKDSLVGLDEDYQKQFAVELTKQGFITIAPDWRAFGERKDRDDWVQRSKRDGCNVAYMAFGYFGYHLLQLHVCDAQRCIDYLQSRGDVDASRLGCMGCSFGGTMTTYVSALDRRIKAAVIGCYLSTLTDALNERNRVNACGSQFLFGLRTWGDIADVAGLIAPRPCMVQIASDDTAFIESDAKEAFGQLERIYTAADDRDKLELDCFQGEHEVDVAPAVAFLIRHLS